MLLLGFLGNILGLSGRQEEEPDDDDENCIPLDQIEVKKDSPNRAADCRLLVLAAQSLMVSQVLTQSASVETRNQKEPKP